MGVILRDPIAEHNLRDPYLLNRGRRYLRRLMLFLLNTELQLCRASECH